MPAFFDARTSQDPYAYVIRRALTGTSHAWWTSRSPRTSLSNAARSSAVWPRHFKAFVLLFFTAKYRAKRTPGISISSCYHHGVLRTEDGGNYSAGNLNMVAVSHRSHGHQLGVGTGMDERGHTGHTHNQHSREPLANKVFGQHALNIKMPTTCKGKTAHRGLNGIID